MMTNEEFDRQNHSFLADFLRGTEGECSQISGSIKATLAQFLMNMKRGLNIVAEVTGGIIPTEALIALQIQELRRCIVDLGKCVDKLKEGVTIQ